MFVNHRRLGIVATLMLAAYAMVLPGCAEKGPKLAPVKGNITYKGKAVAHGTIMFQPENGPAATAEIDKGAYILKTTPFGDGAVLGKHKVTIISLPDQTGLLPESRDPLPEPLVPFQYSFPDKSGLSGVVEDKENVINYDLK